MFPVYDFSLDDDTPVAAASAGVGAVAQEPTYRGAAFCTDGRSAWEVETTEDCRCPNIPVPTRRGPSDEERQIQAQNCGQGLPPVTVLPPGTGIPSIRPGDVLPPGYPVSPGPGGPPVVGVGETQGMGRMWWLWLALLGAGGYWWWKTQGGK